MALPLLGNGHNVHLIAFKMPSFVEAYKSFSLALNIDQLSELIKIYEPHVDVWHVHNEPSWPVTLIKELSNKPVILDVHDSYLSRLTDEQYTEILDRGEEAVRITSEERNNFQLADGLVFPSESFADLICDEFKLKQPRIILPSYVPYGMYRYNSKQWIGGLVYEGRIDIPKDIAEAANLTGFSYCEYSDLAKKCHELGVDFHIYAIREDEEFKKIYKDIAFLHQGLHYRSLLKTLQRHDWGLVGNINKTSQWEVAFPNKMFEYIAAGVPVVAINAKTSGDFLEQEGLGIHVKSIEELCERWSEHREIRKNLLKTRKKWSMDEHIYKLENLYNEVLRG